MSTGVKEYTIKINGVDVSLRDVTKLSEAVNKLDAAVKASNAGTVAAGKATAAKAKAITDEQKAAERLAATQKKLSEANSEANRAQIEANIQLRERTREITRQIAQEQLAEGSIKQMGMQLTDLRNEYESLSAAERANIEVGGQLLAQIQELDAEYKALRESTGNFRDSVGNYGRALEGIENLSGQIEGATKTSLGFANTLMLGNSALSLFGAESEESAEAMRKLQQITALLNLVQQANTNLLKDGVKWGKQFTTGIVAQSTAIRAKAGAETVATKATVGATVAQKAFNVVASANPYVLLALAVVAVGAALYAFATRTDDAAKAQERLNAQQLVWLDMLEREATKMREVGESRIRELERQLALLQAQEGATADIRKVEDELAKERATNAAKQRGFYAREIADLDKNREALEANYRLLERLNDAKARGLTSLRVDMYLDGKVKKVDVEEAITDVQSRVDALGRKVEIGVTLTEGAADITAAEAVRLAERAKADRELAKQAADRAKQRSAAELAAIRAAEDLRIKLIEDSYAQSERTIQTSIDRQQADLRRRLAEEADLTAAARKAINEQIVALDLDRERQLAELDAEYRARDLAAIREAEDAKISLIRGAAERSRAEINAEYDRQIEDLRKRLETEKDLTGTEQGAINQQIVYAARKREAELEALTIASLERRADIELQSVEVALDAAMTRIGEITKRGASGVIDAKATRANAQAAASALGTYIEGLQEYQRTLVATQQAAVLTMEVGSEEFEESMLQYQSNMARVTAAIKDAQKEQAEAVKEGTEAQAEYYAELFEKINQYAAMGVEALLSVTDTWAMGLQFILDGLNEELEAVDQHFEEAQSRREQAVENIEKLEERMRNASGQTSEALRIQLQDAMAARKEAEREEARLAKEKERREAEIRKREKQMRRAELAGSIAMGIANTAQAVTKMLTLVWPLNLVMAAVVGAAGAVQVGMMTRQLTKLADGGVLDGPSHAQGGIPIMLGGTPSYEAEGGEFVINKDSTAANMGLLGMINDADGPVSLSDIAGLLAGSGTGASAAEASDNASNPVVDAIRNIELRPVVAVKDILDVSDNMTEVTDLADFER